MLKTSWILALTEVLLLLLLGHGFGAELPPVPTPEWSKVHYDPKLTEDTSIFFRLLQSIVPPSWKEFWQTDKCYFTSSGIPATCGFRIWLINKTTRAHDIGFDIVKQEPDPTMPSCLEDCIERLSVKIMDGRFTCSYFNSCCWRYLSSHVKRQELTMDKQTYRMRDVITGRIDFECLAECPQCQDKPEPVIVKGVFKTILK